MFTDIFLLPKPLYEIIPAGIKPYTCDNSRICQNENKPPERLKVFIDCSGTWCNMDFIRSEITLVDFSLDHVAADVHVLITSQMTGGGGEKYQLIFFGQNFFAGMKDTLHFVSDANATEYETRDFLVGYIKLGLAPYIAKTPSAKEVIINMKNPENQKAGETNTEQKDPWNFWVYRVSANGNMNADANYNNLSYSGYLSANRVTDKIKIGFSFGAGKNRSVFKYDDDNGSTEKFTVNNHNISFSHNLVRSINRHWSWAYETNYYQTTFSNYKHQLSADAGIEYDIYPYSEVNNKLFTISYKLGVFRNRYYDSTIYDKLQETLPFHRADANLTLNQKWGTASFGISYQNFLNNWSFFNLGVNGFFSVRITGGLSFNVAAFGGLTRDQVFLPKEGATEQEVLTRRRQLASGYNYYTSFGISYRFGSKLNNFVNPRFESGSGSVMYF